MDGIGQQQVLHVAILFHPGIFKEDLVAGQRWRAGTGCFSLRDEGFLRQSFREGVERGGLVGLQGLECLANLRPGRTFRHPLPHPRGAVVEAVVESSVELENHDLAVDQFVRDFVFENLVTKAGHENDLKNNVFVARKERQIVFTGGLNLSHDLSFSRPSRHSPCFFMNLAKRDERRRTLFLSYLYPSFFGSGSQIRAAALVRMLAEREDVHLLVVYPHTRNRGTRDVELERLCRKVEFMPFQGNSAGGDLGPQSVGEAGSEPRVVPEAELIGAIRRFYDENELNSLFVFRLESCFLLKGHLDSFPRRFLDLDESAWRRINMLDRIKTISSASTPEVSDRRLQMALRMMEREMVPRFQKIFVSSETEQAEVGRLTGLAHIHVLPNIFPHRPSLPPPPASQVREIFFVGLFSHFPNLDAVLYFHREIFPLIQKKLAAPVIFRVVGSPCSNPLLEIGRDSNVRLMGYQADLEPFYASASVAVVPLRAGAGTRIKILEAFAHGRPVVSTTIGAAGLAVTHGADILLADEPEAFAQACVQILESPALAARLVENGARLHRERYSPEILQRCYDEVVGG